MKALILSVIIILTACSSSRSAVNSVTTSNTTEEGYFLISQVSGSDLKNAEVLGLPPIPANIFKSESKPVKHSDQHYIVSYHRQISVADTTTTVKEKETNIGTTPSAKAFLSDTVTITILFLVSIMLFFIGVKIVLSR